MLEIWIILLTSVGVVHSTWHIHAPTFNKWHKKKKNNNNNKKLTLHINMAQLKMWVVFFSGLHYRQSLWYKGEKCDSKEWDLNYEHPFPRVSGY